MRCQLGSMKTIQEHETFEPSKQQQDLQNAAKQPAILVIQYPVCDMTFERVSDLDCEVIPINVGIVSTLG
jgi:hypothetical protein